MDDPKTFEEALEMGFEPIADLDQFLSEQGLSASEFAERKKHFTTKRGVSCATAPAGTKCLDWVDENGVHTVCFCTPAKACGNCATKATKAGGHHQR
jgi:hypothetical protein